MRLQRSVSQKTQHNTTTVVTNIYKNQSKILLYMQPTIVNIKLRLLYCIKGVDKFEESRETVQKISSLEMECFRTVSWSQTGMGHTQPKDLFLFSTYSVTTQFIYN